MGQWPKATQSNGEELLRSAKGAALRLRSNLFASAYGRLFAIFPDCFTRA